MKRKGNVMLVFIIQIMIFLLAFIGIVKLSVLRSPVDGIFYYPKPVQERAVQLSLTDKKTIRIRAIVFMSLFALALLILPLVFTGVWSRITDFKTAYARILTLLTASPWFDTIVIDYLWVGKSGFWKIRGAEDLPYRKTGRQLIGKFIRQPVVYALLSIPMAYAAVHIARGLG